MKPGQAVYPTDCRAHRCTIHQIRTEKQIRADLTKNLGRWITDLSLCESIKLLYHYWHSDAYFWTAETLHYHSKKESLGNVSCVPSALGPLFPYWHTPVCQYSSDSLLHSFNMTLCACLLEFGVVQEGETWQIDTRFVRHVFERLGKEQTEGRCTYCPVVLISDVPAIAIGVEIVQGVSASCTALGQHKRLVGDPKCRSIGRGNRELTITSCREIKEQIEEQGSRYRSLFFFFFMLIHWKLGLPWAETWVQGAAPSSSSSRRRRIGCMKSNSQPNPETQKPEPNSESKPKRMEQKVQGIWKSSSFSLFLNLELSWWRESHPSIHPAQVSPIYTYIHTYITSL